MKYLALSFLLVLFLFSSCKKDAEDLTIVSGLVLEQGTATPVPHALVKLVRLRTSTYNRVETILDTMRSDDDSGYHFEHSIHNENDARISYAVYVGEADQYYVPYSTTQVEKNISRGRTQNLDLHIIPFAWVRMICKNTLGNDLLDINSLMGSNKHFTIWTDSAVVSKAYGNYEVNIRCFYTRNSNSEGQRSYTVFTKGHDTTDVSIAF